MPLPGSAPSRLTLLAVTLIVSSATFAASRPTFRAPLVLDRTPFHTVIATGDFDGDGLPDVAVAGFEEANVSVLINGGGLVKPAASIRVDILQEPDVSVTTGVVRLAAADLDRDGRDELIAFTSNTVLIYHYHDGNFETPRRYRETPLTNRGVSTLDPSVGDLNGDGYPDLLLGLELHINDGSGGLLPRQQLVCQSCSGFTLDQSQIADADGDGRADVLLTAHNSAVGSLVTFRGAGNGTFEPPVTRIFQDHPIARVAVADFNRDGRPDLAVAVTSNPALPVVRREVDVYLRQADGTYGAPSITLNTDGSAALLPVRGPGGTVDLVAFADGGTARVMRNDTLGAFEPTPLYAFSSGIVYARVADYDGDGTDEVVVLALGMTSVASFEADRTLRAPLAIPLPSDDASFVQGVRLADVDGDGHTDVVFWRALTNQIDVLTGDGEGNVASLISSPAPFPPLAVLVADLDGDGAPDAVLMSGGQHREFAVLKGNGGGRFSGGASLAQIPENTFEIQLADVTGDGRPDLLALNGSLLVFAGNGDGTFSITPVATLKAVVSGATYDIDTFATGDFDGDGRTDIVANTNTGNFFYRSLAGGSFAPAILSGGSASDYDAVVADFDGDGHLDLVQGQAGSTYYLGSGGGSFDSLPRLPAGIQNGLAAGALTCDLRQSLVAATADGVYVDARRGGSVFVGAPSGTAGFVEDFDGDGMPEIVVNDRRELVVIRTDCGATATGLRVVNGETELQLRATVEGADFFPGVVTFEEDGQTIGSAPVVDGVASLTVPQSRRGWHTLRAHFVGTDDIHSSSSAFVHVRSSSKARIAHR